MTTECINKKQSAGSEGVGSPYCNEGAGVERLQPLEPVGLRSGRKNMFPFIYSG